MHTKLVSLSSDVAVEDGLVLLLLARLGDRVTVSQDILLGEKGNV